MSDGRGIKIPFTTFDVLSNIIPALVFVVGILYTQKYSKFINVLIKNFEESAYIFSTNQIQYLPHIFISLSVIVMLFCIGHLIMALGSLIIDRILIGQGLGYPYIRLLGLTRTRWEKFSSRYYIMLSTLFYVFFIVLFFVPDKKIAIIFSAVLTNLIAIKLIVSFINYNFRKEENELPHYLSGL